MTTATTTDTALVSVDDLARSWGVGDEVIRALISAGRLRAHRVGRLIRIRPADADAYLDSTLMTPK